METIKNYLETMFASMPNTVEVRKAKAELLQMMEDKYNELMAEGQSENAAVGTVISEFGNLDELALDLGLEKEVEVAKGMETDSPRRQIVLDDVKRFLDNRFKKALFLAAGVMLCIISVSAPILIHSEAGAALMFVIVALGVGAIVFSGFVDSEWDFMNKELCMIDIATADYVKEKSRDFISVRAICVTIGVILCVASWVPCLLFDGIDAGPALLFLLVGIGVFLIVYSGIIGSGFDKLLHLNDRTTISGTYAGVPDETVKYVNKTAETIVAVYWPTVTCLYLILSFLTFRWEITWIIWPIAAVAHRAVVINCIDDSAD